MTYSIQQLLRDICNTGSYFIIVERYGNVVQVVDALVAFAFIEWIVEFRDVGGPFLYWQRSDLILLYVGLKCCAEDDKCSSVTDRWLTVRVQI